MAKKEVITPEEYVRIWEEQKLMIRSAERTISEAYDKAHRSKIPKNIRPATAKDMQEGTIIWHKMKRAYGGNFWNIVAEVYRSNDPYKAYCADDGCRYGLEDAFVVKEENA